MYYLLNSSNVYIYRISLLVPYYGNHFQNLSLITVIEGRLRLARFHPALAGFPQNASFESGTCIPILASLRCHWSNTASLSILAEAVAVNPPTLFQATVVPSDSIVPSTAVSVSCNALEVVTFAFPPPAEPAAPVR